jgi:nucleoside-diphosphate-sugar epimerase
MKVLITGIDGFTGVHLEDYLLSKGYDVYGTVIDSQPNTKHIACDIRSKPDVYNVLESVQPEFIIHLAAISFVGEENSSLIYDINVMGTQNILDAALALKVKPSKVILVSSATVYGNQGKEVLDESMCPAPVNHYGISKLAMEHVAATYFDKLDIIITRPFNYTGVGQAEHFLIPKIVTHYQDDKKTIELGNLHVAREFNSIAYVCDVYLALLKSQAHSTVVNLASNTTIKLLDVIETMNSIASYDIQVQVNPAFVRANEIPSLSGSTEKLFLLLPELKNYQHNFKTLLETMYNAT